jgi:hypothetical protein
MTEQARLKDKRGEGEGEPDVEKACAWRLGDE